MKDILTVISLILILPIYSNAQDKQYPDEVQLPAELQLVLDNYEKYWTAFDADGLASLFTEDGFILRPDRDPVKGKESIAKAYEGSGGSLYLWAYDYSISDDIGFILGGYSGGEGMKPWGKFTLTLKKVDGNWLIHSDMDNGNNPR